MSVIDLVARPHVRRRWLFVGGGTLAVLAGGTATLGRLAGSRAALAWAGVAAPLLAYEAYFFHSRREGGPVAVRAANAVTLMRGWLFAAVGGFVALGPTTALVPPGVAGAIAWVPGLCYGLGAALDQVDGRLARYTGTESHFGERLDMAVDTLGFVVAPGVAVAWGRLPVWYLSLAAARYCFKAGRGYRRWRGLPVHDLSPHSLRRTFSGLQMAFLTVALLPLVTPDTLAVLAAVVLTPSLAMFGRDYLVMAGYYRP
ncbi:MAG: CDP-alcohol phosphatidyltransferase family protein [Halobacteriales archaeon SW_9_67_25]|nr:MAG: CDP-alcohol phosphatidyltransferase family protein [Halobacteriales archaeon SW_9_67_25]